MNRPTENPAINAMLEVQIGQREFKFIISGDRLYHSGKEREVLIDAKTNIVTISPSIDHKTCADTMSRVLKIVEELSASQAVE